MGRKRKRTPQELKREAEQARARRAAGYARPPRSDREKEQGRDRARRRRRILMGWPADRLDAPPRPFGAGRGGIPRRPIDATPLAPPAIGHPLFEQARALLRRWEASDFDRDMDTIAADLVGEYVLAALEGRDGAEAMRAFRRRHNHDRKVLVYGTAMVDGLTR